MNMTLRTGEATQRLRHAVSAHTPAALASSFGVEDMVILDLIAALDLPVEVFTLDTGRLHDETHAFIETVRQRYGRPIQLFAPEAAGHRAFRRRARAQPVLPVRRPAPRVLRSAQGATRSRARWPERSSGSPDCAATSRLRARTRRSSRTTRSTA